MERKYFGTDGIRGRVGTHPISPEFVLKLGWAIGRVLAPNGGGKVIIGKDTRISGYMFESALQAGLSAAGVDIGLLGPMPTPAIAYLTRTLHAKAGIVISASHNPYYDNGVKLFSSKGKKLSDEIEQAIEASLSEPMSIVDSAKLGKAQRIGDAGGRYIEFCKSTVSSQLDLKGLTIVVDAANGATYHVAPDVFTELGARVISVGVAPDGLNINEQCGSTHPELLRQAVISKGADLGIALDGDGDRVIMVDHKGEIVDGDELLFVIAQARQFRAQLKGSVVGTVMSNLGLEVALKSLDIGFERTPVGDRYVMEKLDQNGWNVGGESSGHLICLDRTTTGDGIVSALQVIESMVETGKSLYELKSGMTKYPQTLINVKMSKKVDISGCAPITDAVRLAEKQLAGSGRVLLRTSGTEPLVRVMVEGRDATQVQQVAMEIAEIVEQTLKTR